MDESKKIKILMQDRCTRKEAEKHLKTGTIIYDDPQEYIDNLKENDCFDPEHDTLENYRRGVPDISMVKYNNREYLIAYCN